MLILRVQSFCGQLSEKHWLEKMVHHLQLGIPSQQNSVVNPSDLSPSTASFGVQLH